ncbi:MAG TPA: hypothetical protein VF679_13160 [Pedobacter sp.]|jgi:hypothetical protein
MGNKNKKQHRDGNDSFDNNSQAKYYYGKAQEAIGLVRKMQKEIEAAKNGSWMQELQQQARDFARIAAKTADFSEYHLGVANGVEMIRAHICQETPNYLPYPEIFEFQEIGKEAYEEKATEEEIFKELDEAYKDRHKSLDVNLSTKSLEEMTDPERQVYDLEQMRRMRLGNEEYEQLRGEGYFDKADAEIEIQSTSHTKFLSLNNSFERVTDDDESSEHLQQ